MSNAPLVSKPLVTNFLGGNPLATVRAHQQFCPRQQSRRFWTAELRAVAIEKTFTDKASGKDTNRPELARAIEYLRNRDTLVVHSMDRLALTLKTFAGSL